MKILQVFFVLLLSFVSAQNPTERYGHEAVATKNGLVLIGGFTTRNEIDVPYLRVPYNTLKIRFTIPKPFRSWGLHACVYDEKEDKIYCLGGLLVESSSPGNDPNTYVSKLWTFSFDSMTWTSAETKPTLYIADHKIVIVNDKIYIYGRSLFYTEDFWVLDYKSAEPSIVPVTVTSAQRPQARFGHCLVKLADSTMAVIFGRSETVLFNDTWIFDTKTSGWSQLTPAPSSALPLRGRVWPACTKHQSKVFVFGGTAVTPGSGLGATNDVLSLDLNSNTWTIFSSPDMGSRTLLTVAALDNYIVVQGGLSTSTSEFLFFNPLTSAIKVDLESVNAPNFNGTSYLSAGAVVGIVLGTLALLLFTSAGIIYYKKNKGQGFRGVFKRSRNVTSDAILPQSNIFSGARDTMTSLQTITEEDKKETMVTSVVIAPYTPKQDDEMELQVGDVIWVQSLYGDGWGFGVNISNNKRGVIPLLCLQQQSDEGFGSRLSWTSHRGAIASRITERSSSYESLKHNTIIGSIYTQFDKRSSWLATDRYIVTVPYAPVYEDEIKLAIGDEVIISTKFDDGWCYGTNLLNKETGIFPLSSITTVSAETIQEHGENLTPDDLLRIAVSKVFDKKKLAHVSSSAPLGKEFIETIMNAHIEDGKFLSQLRTASLYSTGVDAPNKIDENTRTMMTTSVISVSKQRLTIQSIGTSEMRSNTSSLRMSMLSRNVITQVRNKNYYCIAHFSPNLPDEIELKIGDSIIVREAFEDGWCIGKNERTGDSGFFPTSTINLKF